jgi:hypothetical protein
MATLWSRLGDAQNGGTDDWTRYSERLGEPVPKPQFQHPWWLAEFDERSDYPRYHLQHPRAPNPMTMIELDFSWLWTPETTMAVSMLMVVLAIFLFCWISHKIGEVICTTMAGIMAMSMLLAVFFVFISQWW